MAVRHDDPVKRGWIESDFGQSLLHLLAGKPGIRKYGRIIALDEKSVPRTAAGERGDFHPLLSYFLTVCQEPENIAAGLACQGLHERPPYAGVKKKCLWC